MATTFKSKPFNQLSRCKKPSYQYPSFTNLSLNYSTKVSSESLSEGKRLARKFDPKIPIEKAITPPSSWYTHPSFLALEVDRIFSRGWQAVGCAEHIKEPGTFFTGRLENVEYVVCRDSDGNVRAFHNVCRHHASLLASGSGRKSCFVCPYHGWTYGLDGALLKATRISGIQNFNVHDLGLKPLLVAIWGPFVLLNLEEGLFQQDDLSHNVGNEWLGSAEQILRANGISNLLSYICRREYTIDCNWKVFCDNYLDGGYHVPYAHKGLASGLMLESYSTTLFDKVSIQQCDGGSADNFGRVGPKALYAFVYPNFMINRYGPWMDTNLVLPLGPRKCQVIFDYFLEEQLKAATFRVALEVRVCLKEENFQRDLLSCFFRNFLKRGGHPFFSVHCSIVVLNFIYFLFVKSVVFGWPT